MPRVNKSEIGVALSKVKQAANLLVKAAKHGEKEHACNKKAHFILSGDMVAKKRGRKPKD